MKKMRMSAYVAHDAQKRDKSKRDNDEKDERRFTNSIHHNPNLQ